MLQAREALDNLPWARSTTDKPWRVRVLALALAISLLANTLLVARLGTTIGTIERDYDSHLTYCEFPAQKRRSRSCRQLVLTCPQLQPTALSSTSDGCSI